MVEKSQQPGDADAVSLLTPLLSKFTPASMELLEQRKLTTRSDWKFLLPTEALPDLLDEMKETHALLYAGEALVARYRSRYYDSEEMQCYQDHRRKKPRRFKLRHRHYLDRSLSMFEIKEKGPRGDTRKKRIEVPFMRRGGDLDESCREIASEYLHVPIDGFTPSLDNRFSRITLLAYEAEERITIDLDLVFSHNGCRVDLPGLSIVEVKSASPRHLTPTFARLTRAGVRPQGMSKYCAGVTLLDTDSVPSWFASLRRRIEELTDPTFAEGNV